jgi:hypothetical protein
MTNEYEVVTNTQPYAEDLGVATENNEPASPEGQGVSVTRNVIPMAVLERVRSELALLLENIPHFGYTYGMLTAIHHNVCDDIERLTQLEARSRSS